MGWEFTMRKSDGVRVHRKKERLGESSLWEKGRWYESSPWEKERWGESSQREWMMGWEFTIGKSDGVRYHHGKKSNGGELTREKERWGQSWPWEKERWGARWFREKNGYRLEESTKFGTQALYNMGNKFSLGATWSDHPGGHGRQFILRQSLLARKRGLNISMLYIMLIIS